MKVLSILCSPHRPILLNYGLWDQIRVDHGSEFFLLLHVQDILASLRRNCHRSPFCQTQSTRVRSQWYQLQIHGVHVEFPDSDGKFWKDNFDSLDSLTVHATVNDTVTDSQEVHGLPPSTTQLFSTPTAGVMGSASGFSGLKTSHRQRWMPNMSNKGKGKGPTSCIKVTLAGRKPDGSAGTQKSQCFLNLTNEDANVPAITRMLVRDQFQENTLMLSSPNGLAIPDSSATSGEMQSYNLLFVLKVSKSDLYIPFSRTELLESRKQGTVCSSSLFEFQETSGHKCRARGWGRRRFCRIVRFWKEEIKPGYGERFFGLLQAGERHDVRYCHSEREHQLSNCCKRSHTGSNADSESIERLV